ncbi:MAG: AGE family epimerase/isomerase, partial [Bacteroidota bacterium]
CFLKAIHIMRMLPVLTLAALLPIIAAPASGQVLYQPTQNPKELISASPWNWNFSPEQITVTQSAGSNGTILTTIGAGPSNENRGGFNISNGGFYGKVDDENHVCPESPKGLVLNSRILWSFSAAYNFLQKEEYLLPARRAFDYIKEHFLDKEFGGAYWSVDFKGNMLNGKKQIYGLAFCIYGLSEFYKMYGDEDALRYAIDLFQCMEKYSYDGKLNGYFEAFTREWNTVEDFRLSEKDDNEKKTMNTHLHIIEAYANLYEVWNDSFLKNQVENLFDVFDRHIIDKSGHLHLFFDEQWISKSGLVSFGHDVEAAWLLQQCAEKIQNEKWREKMKYTAVQTANAAAEGLDNDGALWYEFDSSSNHLVKEKHWWPQAEAMIGFMNAFEITQQEKYLTNSYNAWQFIKNHIRDNKYGEWFWGINEDYSIMKNQDKAGFWKCPYHNSRACIEVIKRLDNL